VTNQKSTSAKSMRYRGKRETWVRIEARVAILRDAVLRTALQDEVMK
jgi:hypothetical protein